MSDIEVSLSAKSVVFRRGSKSETLEPVLYLSAGTGTRRILAIGGVPHLTEPFERVDLLNGQALKSEDLKKHEVLEAFFRYGFIKLSKRMALVRPRVVFLEADSVSSAFGGYERSVLSQAASEAGAREVIFKKRGSAV